MSEKSKIVSLIQSSGTLAKLKNNLIQLLGSFVDSINNIPTGTPTLNLPKVSGTHTIQSDEDGVILIGSTTVTFPLASENPGKVLHIISDDLAGHMATIVTSGSDTKAGGGNAFGLFVSDGVDRWVYTVLN